MEQHEERWLDPTFDIEIVADFNPETLCTTVGIESERDETTGLAEAHGWFSISKQGVISCDDYESITVTRLPFHGKDIAVLVGYDPFYNDQVEVAAMDASMFEAVVDNHRAKCAACER